MIPNHYKILGISRNASKKEIKKAYRKLALEWHPDKNKTPKAHQEFIKINKAYLILSDDEARVKYNYEYDYYFNAERENSISGSNGEKNKSGGQKYKDEDLSKWSKSAEKQGEEYASMSFDEFYDLVNKIVREVGTQSMTAVIYAVAGVIGVSSIISFFSGIYYGDIPQILFSLILFGFAITGINFTSKKYI